MTAREILEAALALPLEERVRLLEALEASLPDDEDEEFVAMVNERIAASDAAGPCTPADEVFAHLLAK